MVDESHSSRSQTWAICTKDGEVITLMLNTEHGFEPMQYYVSREVAESAFAMLSDVQVKELGVYVCQIGET